MCWSQHLIKWVWSCCWVGVANLEGAGVVIGWEGNAEVHERFKVDRAMLTREATKCAAKLALEREIYREREGGREGGMGREGGRDGEREMEGGREGGGR